MAAPAHLRVLPPGVVCARSIRPQTNLIIDCSLSIYKEILYVVFEGMPIIQMMVDEKISFGSLLEIGVDRFFLSAVSTSRFRCSFVFFVGSRSIGCRRPARCAPSPAASNTWPNCRPTTRPKCWDCTPTPTSPSKSTGQLSSFAAVWNCDAVFGFACLNEANERRPRVPERTKSWTRS